MNEVKIAVTVASLILAGVVGTSALKKFSTDDIVTDETKTIETMEVTPEEDIIDEEKTEAKRIYLEKSQSDIHCAVMHVEFDDCVYADNEPEEYAEEESSEADESSSKAEKSESRAEDSSKAEAAATQQTTFTPVQTFVDPTVQSTDNNSIAEESSSQAEESSQTEDSKSEESSESVNDEDSQADSSEDESKAEEEEEKTEEKDSQEVPKAEDKAEDTDSSETVTESEEPESSEEEDTDSSEDESSEEDDSEDESSQTDDSSEPEQEAQETPSEPETSSRAISVTDEEYIMLCNVVGHEYGANWISEYDKALVVEVVMNRVNSPKYPNSIYEVLTQPYQFSGMEGYISLGTFSYQVTDSVKAAVDLYLSDPSQFDHGYYSFWGDGSRNHFY